jgi:hypothetical protein
LLTVAIDFCFDFGVETAVRRAPPRIVDEVKQSFARYRTAPTAVADAGTGSAMHAMARPGPKTASDKRLM